MRKRHCPRCGKPLSPQRVAKRNKYCYLCDKAVKREQSDAAHEKRLESQYGLKPGDYKRLLLAQGGRCAIFGCSARGVSRRLSVDHDHKKGFRNRKAVRGLLCKRHNNMIGECADDPRVFDSLAEYLRHPPAQAILE